MKKILFVATIFKHFRAFHMPYIEWFKQQGWQVDVMASGDDVLDNVNKCHNIPIQRSPFSFANIKAIKKARKIIEDEKYDIVYCHTAMGAVIARLSSKHARNKFGTKVIYVAHGFHFFKDGPKRSWLMYYPMERYLSRYTDAIVTINEEDYQLVKTHKFKSKDVYKIPGIGINTSRLIEPTVETKAHLRTKFGYNQNDFILIYIAEYIERKNHKFIIESLPLLVERIPNIKILFAGRGKLMDEMKALATRLKVERYIEFLGFRSDIGDIIAIADIGISSSRQEGLGINLAEEMFEGLPVVATEDRGHRELVINGYNGFLYPQMDTTKFVEGVETLYLNKSLCNKLGENAKKYIQKFTLANALSSLTEIYRTYM